MENKDVSQIALEKIKESGLKPISRNVFNFKKVLFWSLVGTFLIIGIVSFSVTLSLLFNNDWYLYDKFGFSFIFKSLPYFWFVFLAIFIILGEFYYRKTTLGYRHRTVVIVGVYIILTVFFGIILYLFGIGESIEQSISDNVPVYHIVVFDRDFFWSHPEIGLLSGKIIEINGSVIKVIDLNNNLWIINTDSVLNGKDQIKIGQIIKIVGDQDDGNIFNAQKIYLNQNCCTVR